MLSVVVGKPEGKGPLGWLGRRLEENINIDLELYGIYLVKDRRKTASSFENGNGICVRKDKYSRFLGLIFW